MGADKQVIWTQKSRTFKKHVSSNDIMITPYTQKARMAFDDGVSRSKIVSNINGSSAFGISLSKDVPHSEWLSDMYLRTNIAVASLTVAQINTLQFAGTGTAWTGQWVLYVNDSVDEDKDDETEVNFTSPLFIVGKSLH